MFDEVIEFIKSLYPNQKPVSLHTPVFLGDETKYLNDCIESTFVSYVGKYATKFEELTAAYTGAEYAVAVVNGTAALQVALRIAGVEYGDEVITQPLTFVATANAISHCGAQPVFIDVDRDTMGMSPERLEHFLKENCEFVGGEYLNRKSRGKIRAIMPVHTFGHPCRIDDIVEVGNKYNIPVIEDSAESLGSFYKGQHTGTFGLAGILSFNGNKTITTGGGGMIISNDENFSKKAKHITTTAKLPHRYEYVHDETAYNYRLPNINAAIGVAQMEYLDQVIKNKRETARLYEEFFRNTDIEYIPEPPNSRSNYWLNCVQLANRQERDAFLEMTNCQGIMTRPVWRLMNKLDMYKRCQTGCLEVSEWLNDRIVNVPSGYRN